MSILGSNHCAGSLPDLGVIVNDCQWVISELPQSAQTLLPGVDVGHQVVRGQLGLCLGSWDRGGMLPYAGKRPPPAARQRLLPGIWPSFDDLYSGVRPTCHIRVVTESLGLVLQTMLGTNLGFSRTASS